MKRVTDPHPRQVTITSGNPYILVDKCQDRHSVQDVQDGRYDKVGWWLIEIFGPVCLNLTDMMVV
jgi:hypothetical protein